MGATAIGTGINAPAGYADSVRAASRAHHGAPLITAPDLVEATQDTRRLRAAVRRAEALRDQAVEDLQRPAAAVVGPARGLREINLPPKQPGSSIMPGKVNPVIPEVVNKVCFGVIGSDLTVTMAAEAGQLQLNVFEPVIASGCFEA